MKEVIYQLEPYFISSASYNIFLFFIMQSILKKGQEKA